MNACNLLVPGKCTIPGMISLVAGKRRHDEDVDGRDSPKRQRAGGAEGGAQGGGLRVALRLDVTRDASDLGGLRLDLKPLQVRL